MFVVVMPHEIYFWYYFPGEPLFVWVATFATFSVSQRDIRDESFRELDGD